MKKSFVIRVDEELYKQLEKWAHDEFRSVNGQIEYLIHQSLHKAGRLKKTSPRNKKESDQEES
ncbi:ribbon-helix-helix domain-containing protein [Sphingobacterium humi]|uniref:Arc family DNA-binding protein n=1 Tax=Sphingobacterium humi TaxID=1796905 RepID=A0A6N8L4V7_9SPHI|nr:Arc family DNA-binding protein [Sphingobacterium humi]MVZ62792.1 Arc family DNA-binding protein [Sphingobacterium humi]